ncbi:hypothetical protein N9E03_01580 [bacterium]|jgi:hypothetical protein|nr:hypothetical protein [bacterium]
MKELKNNIKIVHNGGSLSETDLQLIAGTELVENMMRNRIIVVTNNNDIDWTNLMTDVTGLYHIRPLDKSKQIYQLWFETAIDTEQFNKNLYVSKLSNTAHEKA